MKLDTRAQQELAKKHWPTIMQVAKEVASAEASVWGPGIDQHELANEVFAGLAERGQDLSTIRVPQAYLRKDATMRIRDMRRKRLGRKNVRWLQEKGKVSEGDEVQQGLVEVSDGLGEDIAGTPLEWNPERALLFKERVAELAEVIERIIAKVKSASGREALRAFYVHGTNGGEDSTTTKTRMRVARHRAEKTLAPEDIASLRVWRAWQYPDLVNYPPDTEATPLLAVIFGS